MSYTWEAVAEALEASANGPTAKQLQIAHAIGFDLPRSTPTPVAAALLRHELREPLLERPGRSAEIPNRLRALEDDLGASPAKLRINTAGEVSAWFAVRYAALTARGLRKLKPARGDVVARADNPDSHMIISSIGSDGRIHMRGGRGLRAWPNHLSLVARVDSDPTHAVLAAKVNAQIRNSRTYFHPPSSVINHLAQYRVDPLVPSFDSIRELEDLLESGETKEAPFQSLLERHPQLLASLTIGNHGTYVLPQPKLGNQFVPDFLVMGTSSLGPKWIAVELESPRHPLLTKTNRLKHPVRHAVDQVQDWREWLGENVAYAQDSLHLYGLTSAVQGLVIIGRAEPSWERHQARSQIAEQNQIWVRSWDWVRQRAIQLCQNGMQASLIEDDFEDDAAF